MVTPPPLKPGDQVVLIAPGRKIDREIVDKASGILASWGLTVTLSKNLITTEPGYFSAGDQARLSDLQQAIDDPAVRAIICCRGGYGTTRIVDQIRLDGLLSGPKWLCGFSDITALHLRFLQSSVKSIHSTMPIMFTAPDAVLSVESLRRALFGHPIELLFPSAPDVQEATVSGEVVGGNLSLLTDSLGTSTEPDTDGKLLVIEEVDEYLYRIDRMLMQLERAGKLKGLKGLIVGHFNDLKDTEEPFGKSASEIITSYARKNNVPVAYNFPSGHRNPNVAWIHGGEAQLTIERDHCTLRYKN